jgi:hypothetical protein
MIRKLSFLVLAGGLLLGGATSCKNLSSPNFNFADLQDLVENPTPTALSQAATGLLLTWRDWYAAGPNDLYGQLGLLGRESYNMDIADPRFEAEMLSAQLSPDSPAFGGNHWSEPYENVRVGDIILSGIPNSTPPLSDSDRGWLEGFVKTIVAFSLADIALLRTSNCGCPITVSDDLTVPAPAVSADQVWTEVVRLLDEAAGDLAAASGTAPFDLSTGFDGIPGVVQTGFFRTAEGFLQFNRGFRARVAMYRQDWTGMLTALNASFVDDMAPMDLGVYHVFSQQSGDLTNGMAQFGDDPNLRAHPAYKADVELKADASPDDRFSRKTRPVGSRAYQARICLGDPGAPPWPPDNRYATDPGGGTSNRQCDVGFDLYPTVSAPVSIIRNEELLLMRAEANIQLGNLAAAQSDINVVRSVSGGLEPVTLTSANAIDQLLYERQYSLWWEGHRWLDMRRYDRLDELPIDNVDNANPNPNPGVASIYPIPREEQDARQ